MLLDGPLFVLASDCLIGKLILKLYHCIPTNLNELCAADLNGALSLSLLPCVRTRSIVRVTACQHHFF